MKIALDYDGTYTEDPVFWNWFIDKAQLRDHEIMVVTFRGLDMPIDHNLPIPVYYTNRIAKRKFMEAQGIGIDVWIDDVPDLICNGSDWDDERLAKWKAENA